MTLDPKKDPSCVLALAFEEGSGSTAYDISQYGNDGTIYGAMRTTGKIGRALRFDGVDDYVNCGRDRSLNFFDELTVEVWINPDTFTEDRKIAGKGHCCWSGWMLGLGETHYKADFEVWDTDGTHYRPYVSLSEGWNHVVAIYSQSQSVVKIYANGEVGDTLTTAGKLISDHSADDLFIGRGILEVYFKGIIDEVRIYNRALSEKEIIEHYYYGIKQLAQRVPSRYVSSVLEI